MLNFKEIGESLNEMARVYRIPRLAVVDEVEGALCAAMTRLHGYEVDVRITGNGIPRLEMTGYQGTRDGCTVHRIYPEMINKRSVKFLRRRLTQRLNERSVLEEFDTLAPVQGHVCEGVICTPPTWGEALRVDIYHDRYFGVKSASMAVCRHADQPVSERGRYRLGDTLMFYILSVRAIKLNEQPGLEIYVSRTSKSLVEELIRKYIIEKTGSPVNGSIKCIKRVAGVYSRVVSTEQIDRDILHKTSEKINEVIKVEVPNV